MTQLVIATDRLAIVAADGVFTYGDLAAVAERVAAGLGPLREARVAFLVPPSFAHVAIQRGIWLAGGVAVPLAVSHPPVELEHVVRDSGAAIVVGSGSHAAALGSIAHAAGAQFVRTPDLLAGDDGLSPVPANGGDGRPSSRALIVY